MDAVRSCHRLVSGVTRDRMESLSDPEDIIYCTLPGLNRPMIYTMIALGRSILDRKSSRSLVHDIPRPGISMSVCELIFDPARSVASRSPDIQRRWFLKSRIQLLVLVRCVRTYVQCGLKN